MVSMANRMNEWSCKTCGQSVTLFVKPSTAPTHVCKKQRNQTIQLTLKGNQQ